MRRPDAPLSVEIPAPLGDRPAWGKVGIVAACGFVLGIAWPRLTSTRIAPHPPGEGASSAAAVSSASPPTVASVEPVTPGAKTPIAAAPSATAASGDSRVSVGHGTILHCRDDGEEMTDDCGSLELDPIAVPRIKGLAQCPGTAGVTGKLSIGFDVDFRRKELRIMNGKSTTFPKEKAEAFIKCADKSFEKVSLADVPHKHRRYLVFYTASFAGGDKPAEPVAEKSATEGPAAGTTTSESPASGFANVAWDVVLVRDAPKTGAVVGRIMRGSRVKVVAHQGDWYRVVFGSTEGWVYRGTIGL